MSQRDLWVWLWSNGVDCFKIDTQEIHTVLKGILFIFKGTETVQKEDWPLDQARASKQQSKGQTYMFL